MPISLGRAGGGGELWSTKGWKGAKYGGNGSVQGLVSELDLDAGPLDRNVDMPSTCTQYALRFFPFPGQ